MKKLCAVFASFLIGQYAISQTPYALELDGSNDYLLMGDVNDLGTSDFTVEAWMYAESTGSNGGNIVYKGLTTVGTPSNAGYGLRFGKTGPNELNASICGTSGSFYNLYYNNIQLNQWYHVAMVRKAGSVKLYVNCVLVDEIAIPSSLNVDTDMPLTVGAHDKGGLSFNSSFFDGNIDEVRIWTEARDSITLCQWKDCTINTPQPNLLAVYNMDHTTGPLEPDNSGNGNDGAMQGGGTWVPSTVAGGGNCYAAIEDPVKLNEDIMIYPNPSSDAIGLINLSEKVKFQLYDLSGKILLEGALDVNQTIHIGDLNSGTYLLKILSGEQSKTLRFVKH